MPEALPVPSETLPIVDWESEIIIELQADNMFEEMVGMAQPEFAEHMTNLAKMKRAGEVAVESGKTAAEAWGTWPPWKVAHSIKGMCLSLSFARLADYAKAVERLRDDILVEQIDDIVLTMTDLFDRCVQEANNAVKK